MKGVRPTRLYEYIHMKEKTFQGVSQETQPPNGHKLPKTKLPEIALYTIYRSGLELLDLSPIQSLLIPAMKRSKGES